MSRIPVFGIVSIAVTVILLRDFAGAQESSAPPSQPVDQDRKVIRYGGDMDFPPYEWLDRHGVAHGFQVDVIRALAQRMNMDVEVRLGPWHEIYADFLAGEIDVVTMAEQPERRAVAEFCSPHTALVSEIFVRQGAPTITKVDDLDNKEIIVQEDALAAQVIAQRFPHVRLVKVETQRDALQLLASGQHDAAVVVQANGRHIIRTLNLTNLRSTGPAVLNSNYAFCTHKGEIALRDQINDSLNAFKQETYYNQLFSKWLAAPRAALSARAILKWAAITALPVLAFLMAWAAWTRMLRARVAQRTLELQQELRARELAESEVRLLLNELDHRVRNMLASIVALAEQQPGGDGQIAHFRSELVSRIRAMAAAHDAIHSATSTGVTFDGALGTLSKQFGTDLHARIHRDGPHLDMPPQFATPVCMVLHELLSNAVRHGALASNDGTITIHTSADSDGAWIRWIEESPQPRPEVKTGFGLTLLQGLIVHQMRGRVSVKMEPHGLEAEVFLPGLQAAAAATA